MMKEIIINLDFFENGENSEKDFEFNLQYGKKGVTNRRI